jgi:hypothetical protein
VNKKEAVYMKKLIPIVAALGLVFAVGLAYAYEEAPLDMRSVVQDDGITYIALENGVTFFGSIGTGIQCVGAAAGGMATEPSKDLNSIVQDDNLTYIASDNSVTFASKALGPKCSWARGGREMALMNSVTFPGGNQ